MTFVRSLFADLADRSLLPLVALLAGCALLVPVGATVLTHPRTAPTTVPAPAHRHARNAPAPAAAPPLVAPPPRLLQSVIGGNPPRQQRYSGTEVDPFRSAPAARAAAGGPSGHTATTVRTVPAAAARTAPAAGRNRPATAVRTPPVKAAPVRAAPPKAAPVHRRGATPPAAPARLAHNQVYRVEGTISVAADTHSFRNPRRLSPLGSAASPVVYLGVVKGGRRAAFLLGGSGGATGPGHCLPAPTVCQVLVLKPGQSDVIALHPAGGRVVWGRLTVTRVAATALSSDAAARRARLAVSRSGRSILRRSAPAALARLRYSARLGAVVLRLGHH